MAQSPARDRRGRRPRDLDLGSFHPAEVLPRWRAGIEAAVTVPATRDIFWVGMYTGMRRGEIMGLCWDRVDLQRRILRVGETKTGEPLELPITRQLAALFERRRLETGAPGGDGRQWVFPSAVTSSHAVELQHLYAGSAGRPAPGSGSTGSGTSSSRWRSGS